MRLATFLVGTEQRVGVGDPAGGALRDVSALLPPGTGVSELIEDWARWGGELAAGLAAAPVLRLDQGLAAPIPSPRRNILCVGKNYAEHAGEFNRSGFDASAQEDRPPHPCTARWGRGR